MPNTHVCTFDCDFIRKAEKSLYIFVLFLFSIHYKKLGVGNLEDINIKQLKNFININ